MTPDLSRVNAIVRTFLRDEHMTACVRSIERHYPDVQIVLVDDGHQTRAKDAFYRGMRQRGHIVEDSMLPFDSGFGAKSNMAAALCTRPYVLTANDDFLFDGSGDGVREMVGLLDELDSLRGSERVGLVCGTWNHQDYQGWIRRKQGRVEEIPFPKDSLDRDYDWACVGTTTVPYKLLDLCAVYGVFRREVFTGGVRWDARYKIGGEHGDWFMDIKDAGWEVAFTPAANINEVRGALAHPDYAAMRLRQGWKRHYLAKHGPHTYRYFNGQEETFR